MPPCVCAPQNFELISDRPFETMLAELKQLKQEYPDRILIASIMCVQEAAPCNIQHAWEEGSSCLTLAASLVHLHHIFSVQHPHCLVMGVDKGAYSTCMQG